MMVFWSAFHAHAAVLDSYIVTDDTHITVGIFRKESKQRISVFCHSVEQGNFRSLNYLIFLFCLYLLNIILNRLIKASRQISYKEKTDKDSGTDI